MTQPELLASEIRTYCAAHANPKEAARWNRYFSEGYDAWGLNGKEDPFWHQKQQEWLDKYHGLGLRGFLRLGDILFESGKYEEGAAHTDVLCGELIAPLFKTGSIKLNTIAGWRKSKFKYQRRAVPVAMLGLLKTDAEPAPLLDFLRPLMMDPERVVHQGVGWFLREAWKKYPKPVEAFLFEWKNTAPRPIFQYATEKMTAEARAQFRRNKAAVAK